MTVYGRMYLIPVFLIISIPIAGAAIHVAPSGSDMNEGTETSPFQTLGGARDAIRMMKQAGTLPDGPIEILVHPGRYPVTKPVEFSAEDSGTMDAPITYRASETEAPRFSGGVVLGGGSVLEDPEVLMRLPESARGNVVTADLAAAGVTDIIPFELGGFSSGRGFKTHPAPELFVNGEPMVLARWPNEDYVYTGEPTGPQTLRTWDNHPGSPEGRFKFKEERPARWVEEPDAWLYGYWFWDWADSYEKIERINLDTGEILLARPWHGYGYKEDQPYFALNLLCELDAPGEWYLDRARGKVYLYPKEPLDNAFVELSIAPFPLVKTEGLSHVRFQGLLWECGASDGILIEGGEACRLEGCTLRYMAGNGVEIRGGSRHAILSCDIHTLGRGGVVVTGGDRKTLSPGEHLVENCHIHHLSRIDHTYTPGILINGVGHRVRNNCIHDVASSALRVGGNDHLIELNEIYRVVLESDDQGGADMWGNPTFRGNVYRYNYWHHLGNPAKDTETAHSMQAGIRLDDAICGTLIQGNIFHRCSTAPTLFGGVQIHGGKENTVEGNLFADCAAAVSFSPWGEERWQKFVEKALDAPEINSALYLERYPALASLNENHDINTVRNNVVLRCESLFLRAPDGIITENNTELPAGSELPEDADGRLRWSEEEANRLGIGEIPFPNIGLYEDGWRVLRDGNWSLRTSTP